MDPHNNDEERVRMAIDQARELERIVGMVQRVDEKVETLVKLTATTYVTRDEFTPVKAVAFGLVALILTGVIAAILSVVIKQ